MTKRLSTALGIASLCTAFAIAVLCVTALTPIRHAPTITPAHAAPASEAPEPAHQTLAEGQMLVGSQVIAGDCVYPDETAAAAEQPPCQIHPGSLITFPRFATGTVTTVEPAKPPIGTVTIHSSDPDHPLRCPRQTEGTMTCVEMADGSLLWSTGPLPPPIS